MKEIANKRVIYQQNEKTGVETTWCHVSWTMCFCFMSRDYQRKSFRFHLLNYCIFPRQLVCHLVASSGEVRKFRSISILEVCTALLWLRMRTVTCFHHQSRHPNPPAHQLLAIPHSDLGGSAGGFLNHQHNNVTRWKDHSRVYVIRCSTDVWTLEVGAA